MKWKSFLVLVVVFVCPFTTKAAFASHVPDDYPTIQEALDNAVAGEVITVADGTYFENLVWPAVDNLTLTSESGNPEDCVLDGSATEPVILAAPVGTGLTITGVTIQNGYYHDPNDPVAAGLSVEAVGSGSVVLANCRVVDNLGLGIYVKGVSLQISNCLIDQNQRVGVLAEDSNLTAQENIIQNTTNPENYPLNGGGVGVWTVVSVDVQFTNNIVRNNWWGLGVVNFAMDNSAEVTSHIQGNYFDGNGHPDSIVTGGICLLTLYNIDPSLSPSHTFQIDDNNLNNNRGIPPEETVSGGINAVGPNLVGSITNNYVYGQEGRGAFGILVGAGGLSVVNVDRNTVRDTLGLDPEVDGGSGLTIMGEETGTVTATNNFISGNCPTGINIGDMDYEPEALPTVILTNNTVVNSCDEGIVAQDLPGDITITNSIVWGNGDDLVNVAATYSDIEDGDPGEGNISADPLFVDPPGNDFHILPASPCRNTGSNAAPSLPATDYDGDARVEEAVVDMGADEYVPNTSTGDDVEVVFTEAQAEVAFDTVSGEGQTTVDKHIGYPPAPDGFLLLTEPTHVYDVETSADYSDTVTVCVEYEEPGGSVDESLIRLLHEEGGEYVDRTVLPVDTVNNVVCAEVNDFSEFLPAVTECWDLDEDGYGDEACGGDDCDDGNGNVNPGMAENCTNGIDDDCDDLVDDQDPECGGSPWAVASEAQASTGRTGVAGCSRAANVLMVLLFSGGFLVLRKKTRDLGGK